MLIISSATAYAKVLTAYESFCGLAINPDPHAIPAITTDSTSNGQDQCALITARGNPREH